MVAYTMPQQKKKEDSERLRGERDQIKFTDFGFERWQHVKVSMCKIQLCPLSASARISIIGVYVSLPSLTRDLMTVYQKMLLLQHQKAGFFQLVSCREMSCTFRRSTRPKRSLLAV